MAALVSSDTAEKLWISYAKIVCIYFIDQYNPLKYERYQAIHISTTQQHIINEKMRVKSKLMLKKILIAEGHELYIDGLRLLIRRIYNEAQVLEATDYSSAIKHLNTHQNICFLLLDIKIPGTQGLDGLREIRQCFPTLTIIIVSALDSRENVYQMMSLGINGFIAKNTPRDKMVDAINAILAGEQVIISEHDVKNTIEFSPRQKDTLRLLVQGNTNKEIARLMGISHTTVREYVSHILKQLNAKNRTQAVLLTKKLGLFSDCWE